MSWEAVGALGEVIGGVAVVATLVYLSVQTRQNTRAVRHAAARGVMEDANAWRYKIVENPEISELFRSGLRDPESLDPNDRYRFRMFLDALVFHWAHAFESNEYLPKANITLVLGAPGGRWYWERAKDVLQPPFIEFIERQLDERESQPKAGGE